MMTYFFTFSFVLICLAGPISDVNRDAVVPVSKTGELQTCSLTIVFDNIRYTEGQLLLGIYHDQESWRQRKPAREILISKSDLKNGSLRTSIKGLKPGNYGLAVLDDANGNEIVDFGWIFPKEGFGFSNYYHDSLRMPRYSDFAFDLKEDKAVNVKFRYLGSL